MATTVQKNKKLHKLLQRLHEGEMLAYYPDKLRLGGKKGFLGKKKGSHIECQCCLTKVNASKFEEHAGFASRRKPYSYIYVVSTGELLDNSENRCSGCRCSCLLDGASRTQTPDKWFCTSCKNKSRRDAHAERTAIAPVKQTSDISVGSEESKTLQVVETSCCLCRKTDFAIEFGPRTILLCDQCEREYHVGCFNKEKEADLKEEPIGDWFCCVGCKIIHSSLHILLNGSLELSESVTTNCDVSWRLLKSPLCFEMEESNKLFSQAIDVLEEGFGSLPCSMAEGGLLRQIVNGKEDDEKVYRGMYCAVLLVDSEIVSAAVFRVFGQELAELPLVSTLRAHKHKGYFHKNFEFFHKLCKALEVKKIVLPATKAAMGLWLKLGFERMTADQFSEQKETFPDVVEFRDAVMMQLQLSSGPDAANDAEAGTSLNGI